MKEHENINVAIVEDEDEIRDLLALLIGKSPGFSCEQSFPDCESAIAAFEISPPDVVLMDIELPGMSGIEGVQKLANRLQNTDFIMLTIRDDDNTVFEALSAGASGYLLKDTPPVR